MCVRLRAVVLRIDVIQSQSCKRSNLHAGDIKGVLGFKTCRKDGRIHVGLHETVIGLFNVVGDIAEAQISHERPGSGVVTEVQGGAVEVKVVLGRRQASSRIGLSGTGVERRT